MLRHRLTDEQWNLISDVFPEPKRTGAPPSGSSTGCGRHSLDLAYRFTLA